VQKPVADHALDEHLIGLARKAQPA